MKRILSVLAIMMVAIVGRVSADDAIKWVDVYNAQEFKEAVMTKIDGEYKNNIRLRQHIDLSTISGSGSYLFKITFKGRITGARHVYIRETGDSYYVMPWSLRSSSKTLFQKLDGAEISHLCVMDCSYSGRQYMSGQFTDECYNTTFTEVVFSGCSSKGDSNWHDCNRMGITTGKAEGCNFSNMLFIDCQIQSDGACVGCVAGQAERCSFTNCMTNALCELWADGDISFNNSGYVGGICGSAYTCYFNKCTNAATVSADDDRIGGIVGCADDESIIMNCNNCGVVRHCTKDGVGRNARHKVSRGLYIAGVSCYIVALVADVLLSWNSAQAAAFDNSMPGIYDAPNENPLGFNYYSDQLPEGWNYSYKYSGSYHLAVTYDAFEAGTLSLGECFGLGFVFGLCISSPYAAMAVGTVLIASAEVMTIYDMASAPDEIGGIAGTVFDSTVSECMNAGPVQCGDNECGGIVGHLGGGTVEKCYNRSFIKSRDDDTGGIVGHSNNGIIRYNLNVGPVSSDGSNTGAIVGAREGSTKVEHNWYLADEEDYNSEAKAFPQSWLPTATLAKNLNEQLEGYGQKAVWHQNIGEDFYPVLNDSLVDEKGNYVRPIVTRSSDAYINKYGLKQMVNSSEDFYLAVANPNAEVSIQEDLDMEQYYFNLSSKDVPFKGKIYGHGHKIYNCSYEVPIHVNSDNECNVALFPYAKNAVFDSIAISKFYITQQTKSWDKTYQNGEAFLVANSTGCTYNNIKIDSCSITRTGKSGDDLFKVGGVVSQSHNDTFTDCTLGKQCKLEGYLGWIQTINADVAGIASKAWNSTFTRCANHATLWADDNQVAGIVGYASGCTIDRCLNTGHITAQECVGGIVGNAANATVVHRCVNTGVIDDDDHTRENKRAGIAGLLQDKGSEVKQCLNFGSVNHADNDYGEIVGGREDDATEWNNAAGLCYYYCQYNGDHKDNEGTYPDNDLYRWAKMTSGEFAYKSTVDNESNGDKWLYQDIDYGLYPTNFPVPIPAAGEVHLNVLCDGTETYSTRYQGTAGHTSSPDANGMCTICGNLVSDPAKEIHITDANGLNQLATASNKGADYSKSIIYLDNDIDLDGYSFIPICRSTEHPFIGTFDGQGHRIKNMTLYFDQGCLGLFGCAAGKNTIIKNVIIDSSCTVTATGNHYGIAGLLGGIQSTSGSECNVSIENCGNEASVTGYGNVAGLLGGVFVNDATVVNVNNCYNTGTISGTSNSETGSIVGYARKHTSIRNSYNSGTVGGTTDYLTFAYIGEDDFDGTIENCYTTTSWDKTPNVTMIEDIQVRYGDLCKKLNENGNIFTQNVLYDAHPVPGTDGLAELKEMHVGDVTSLNLFASMVNGGYDFTNTPVYLDNDINMAGYDFTPIGDYPNYPFKGTFNGNFHRIKYLDLANGETSADAGRGVGFFGYVAGTSTIEGLILDSSCEVHGSEWGTGGIVGCVALPSSSSTDAIDFTLKNCGNEAKVSGNLYVGGLVGGVFDTDLHENVKISITDCYNTGNVSGNDQMVAGFVGWGNNDLTVKNCYNTGTVTGYAADCSLIRYDDHATTHFGCLYNLESVSNQKGAYDRAADQFKLGGVCKELRYVSKVWSQELETYDHPTFTSNAGIGYSRSTESPWSTICLPFDVATSENYDIYDVKAVSSNTLTLSKRATTLTAGTPALIRMSEAAKNAETGLYDVALTPASTTISTTITPVALADGLTLTGVYSAVNLKGTANYNVADSTFYSVASVGTLEGLDSICNAFHAYIANTAGSDAEKIAIPYDIHLTDAEDLNDFGNSVRGGRDYTGATVYLDNDIEFVNEDKNNFTSIGTEANPFCGTFDGQGHRIKNLIVVCDTAEIGLFGVIAGEHPVIRNTIIDSSCSITSNATSTTTSKSGVAGLVGCVQTKSGSTCNLTIENCGNEADIKGYDNAAGILGGVYVNDDTNLTITNCYNTGAINGQTTSATICGYARKNYTITGCYNSGTLNGIYNTDYLYHGKAGGTTSVSGCYDVNGSQTGVTQITADNVASGELCFWLNGNKAAGTWGHTGDNAHPVLSGEGMQHYSRTMANQWGTICLPFTAESGSNYDFYELTGVDGDALKLNKVSTLEAGTPAIIRRDGLATGIDVNAVSGTTFAYTPVEGSSSGGLTLTGSYTTKDITSEDGYIIANNAFWNIADVKGENKVYCSPFRAYLAGTANNARCLTIGVGETTGINEVLNGLNSLNGLNGKFIINGRLVIIKDGKEYDAAGQRTE